ncbi:hypothetical protein HOC37_04850 [bacterium]|jgi:hypothetical protein|nr:hypothetical protein [bacterium]MBT3581873.1 hypothetical protein [bacterium]MBT4552290.1 hypothetical protein [bacterium]
MKINKKQKYRKKWWQNSLMYIAVTYVFALWLILLGLLAINLLGLASQDSL